MLHAVINELCTVRFYRKRIRFRPVQNLQSARRLFRQLVVRRHIVAACVNDLQIVAEAAPVVAAFVFNRQRALRRRVADRGFVSIDQIAPLRLGLSDMLESVVFYVRCIRNKYRDLTLGDRQHAFDKLHRELLRYVIAVLVFHDRGAADRVHQLAHIRADRIARRQTFHGILRAIVQCERKRLEACRGVLHAVINELCTVRFYRKRIRFRPVQNLQSARRLFRQLVVRRHIVAACVNDLQIVAEAAPVVAAFVFNRQRALRRRVADRGFVSIDQIAPLRLGLSDMLESVVFYVRCIRNKYRDLTLGDRERRRGYRDAVVAVFGVTRRQNIRVGARILVGIRAAVGDSAQIVRVHQAFHRAGEGRVSVAVGLARRVDRDRHGLRRHSQGHRSGGSRVVRVLRLDVVGRGAHVLDRRSGRRPCAVDLVVDGRAVCHGDRGAGRMARAVIRSVISGDRQTQRITARLADREGAGAGGDLVVVVDCAGAQRDAHHVVTHVLARNTHDRVVQRLAVDRAGDRCGQRGLSVAVGLPVIHRRDRGGRLRDVEDEVGGGGGGREDVAVGGAGEGDRRGGGVGTHVGAGGGDGIDRSAVLDGGDRGSDAFRQGRRGLARDGVGHGVVVVALLKAGVGLVGGAAGDGDRHLGVPLGVESELVARASDVGDRLAVGVDHGAVSGGGPARKLVPSAGEGVGRQGGSRIIVDGLIVHGAFAAVGVEVDGVAQLPHGVEVDVHVVGSEIDALGDLLVAEGRLVSIVHGPGSRSFRGSGPAQEVGTRPLIGVRDQRRHGIGIVDDIHLIHKASRVSGVGIEMDGVAVGLDARHVGGVLVGHTVVLEQIGLRVRRGQRRIRGDPGGADVPARNVVPHDALVQARRGAQDVVVVEHLIYIGGIVHRSPGGVVHRVGDRVGHARILDPLDVEGIIVVKGDRAARRVVRALAIGLGVPGRGGRVAIAVDARGQVRDGPGRAGQLGDAVRDRRAAGQVAAVAVVGQGVRGIGHRDKHVADQVQAGLGVLEVAVEVVVAVRPDLQADVDPVFVLKGPAVVPVGIAGIHNVGVHDVVVRLGDQVRILQLDYAIDALGAGDDRGGLAVPVQDRLTHLLHLGGRVVQEVDPAAYIGRTEGFGRGPGGIREERIRRQHAALGHVLRVLILAVLDLLQIGTAGEAAFADRLERLRQDDAVLVSGVIADIGVIEGMISDGSQPLREIDPSHARVSEGITPKGRYRVGKNDLPDGTATKRIVADTLLPALDHDLICII